MNFRQKLLAFSFLLSEVALLGYAFSFAFPIVIFAALAFSLWYFFALFRNPKALNTYDGFRLAICFGYFVGPCINILFASKKSMQSSVILVGPYGYTGYHPSVALAIGTAAAAVAALTLFEWRPLKRKMKHRLEMLSIYQTIVASDIWFVTFLTGLIAYAYHSGALGFMGTQHMAASNNTGGQVTIIGELAGDFLPALLPCIFSLILIERNRIRRFLLLILLAANVIFLAPMGRRYFLFSAFICFIMFMILKTDAQKGGFIMFLKNKPRRFIIILAFAAVSTIATIGFYALRVAGYMIGSNATLAQRIELIPTVIFQNRSYFFSNYLENTDNRPATLLVYLGKLESSSSQHYMLGQCFVNGMINAIPQAIFPPKDALMFHTFPCGDPDVERNFGLPPVDAPTTAVTTGYADFLIIGALGYPVLFASLLGSFLIYFMNAENFAFRVFAFAEIMFPIFFVETGVGAYFIAIRDLIILYILFYAIKRLVSSPPPDARGLGVMVGW